MLGSYDKPLDALTQISVDYSQLTPAAAVVAYTFKVHPGGEPQLAITFPALASNALIFTIKGGIGGRNYTVTINGRLSDNRVRSDVLTVNVLGEDCGPCEIVQQVVNNGITSPDGSLFVNTAPRFFVSSTPPHGARVMDQWWNTTTLQLSSFVTDGTTSYWTIMATSVDLPGSGTGPGWWLTLPTTLPSLPGQLWNNGGVVCVS